MNKDNRHQEEDGQMNIELPADVADGQYSNLAIISHSNSEFILDFVRIVPGVPSAKVKSRIIMTPQHFKRLMFAIQENMDKYESMFGEVAIFSDNNFPHGMGINGPMGIA